MNRATHCSVSSPDSRVLDHQLPNLDGLRAIACLLVVADHAPLPVSLAALGDTGVAVFFVLSGFLMGYLYCHRPWSREAALRYGISRFSRVVPIYWLAITLCVLLAAVSTDFEPKISGVTQIIRHYFFVGAISVYWSISPEIQYYVLFLLIWWSLAFWRIVPSAFLVLLAAIGIAMAYQSSWPGIFVMHKIHFFLFGTFAGMAPRMSAQLPESRWSWWRLTVLFLFFVPLFVVHVPHALYNNIGYALFYSVIIYIISHDCRITNAVLGQKWLRVIGRASFTIYLFHVLIIINVSRFLGIDQEEPSTSMLGIVLLSIALPILASKIIEFPLQSKVKRALERLLLDRVTV